MATFYSDLGYGVRAPVVFYNRCNEAAAQLKADDFDWKAIFAEGVRWFHSGGIFAALSDSTPGVIVAGMKAAKEAGAVVSFDLNYRAKLWNIRGGHEHGVKTLEPILQHVDVLVGNEEDLQMGLGIPGPEVEAKSALDPSAFVSMIGKVTKKHPNIKVVATTLREVHSTNRHSWSAVAWINGEVAAADPRARRVRRVGGGDGFAAGLFTGCQRASPDEAVRLAGHGGLLTTYPGNTTMAPRPGQGARKAARAHPAISRARVQGQGKSLSRALSQTLSPLILILLVLVLVIVID